ncbi:murein transglycosylase domain-containing protein [Desulfurobacterium sp.]
MKKRLISAAIMAFILINSHPLRAEDFNSYYKQNFQEFQKYNRGFSAYKNRINQEFEAYRRIIEEEFSKYKRNIEKNWKDAAVPSRKVFVEYGKNYKSRKIVDFNNATIKIEVIKPGNYREEILKNLTDLIKEKTKIAFKRNPVIANTDRRLKLVAGNAALASQPPNSEFIIGDVLTGKTTITEKEAEKEAEKILKKAQITRSRDKGGTKYTLTFKFPKNKLYLKAKKYKPLVLTASQKYNVEYPLIFAIIHTESSFNPMAVSYVPAYGLMQIVPQTAGRDVTKNLFGKPMVLTPSYLFNKKNNINIGTGYLYLLYYKYFSGIKNPESRLLCTIAAYNGGPGGVARAFTGTTKLYLAERKINTMTPEQVYKTLITKAPMRETRNYVRKVYSRIKLYQNF